MGFFSKPSPPPVPDYHTVSGEQTTANTGAANLTQQLNAISQNNPYGNLSYTFNPATGTYDASQSYTPQQQALFNTLQGTQGIAGQQGQNLLNTANYGGDPNISGNANSQTAQLIAQQMQQLQPQQDYQRSVLDTNLRNQGLVPGMPGYDQQMRQFTNTIQNSNAANAAAFQGQAYNQAMENYQLPAQMSQQLAGFGAPGNIMQNLWNTPQTQVQPANVTGAAANMNQANMAAYQQEMQNRAQSMQAIGQLGMAGVGLATGNPMMMAGLFGHSMSGPGGGGGSTFGSSGVG